jgi:hypothetical protein
MAAEREREASPNSEIERPPRRPRPPVPTPSSYKAEVVSLSQPTRALGSFTSEPGASNRGYTSAARARR